MKDSDCRIGFVGVGRMGANMAHHLKDEGYRVTAVYDVRKSRREELGREIDCEVATAPSEVAERANLVITVVTDDEAMRDIFSPTDHSSLLAHAKDRVFLNCATVTPSIHIEVERLIEGRGGHCLEVCMASSITQAREGTLYLMCGGKQSVFDQVEPLLKSLSTQLRYIGRAGEAAKVKALVNMVMNINTAGLAEGLGLGAALGLDLDVLRNVFAQTGAASRVLETDGEDMVKRDHDCYFSAAHAAKDSGIALGLARGVGLELPLARVTLSQFTRLVEQGKGEMDKSGIAELTFPGRA